jgi:hypothetical protein
LGVFFCLFLPLFASIPEIGREQKKIAREQKKIARELFHKRTGAIFFCSRAISGMKAELFRGNASGV